MTPATVRQPRPEHADEHRLWQGIPSITRSPGGRLWAAWYSGGPGEGPGNYVLLASSADGAAWSAPSIVIEPPPGGRCYDPAMWHDPLGRLWVFWCQTASGWFDGRPETWAILAEDGDAPAPNFSAPRFLALGTMMNQPTVTQGGDWLFPIALWRCQLQKLPAELQDRACSSLYRSTDQGETCEWLGGPIVPDVSFDEHLVVERRNGQLWLLVRTHYGVAESISDDGGRTWSPPRDSRIYGPDSRFFVGRLASGALLMVNHAPNDGRQSRGRVDLSAWLSDDDGATWQYETRLFSGGPVSYPDAVEGPDGAITAIYDFERADANWMGRSAERKIFTSTFTEAGMRSGCPEIAQAVVNQARG